MNNMVLLFFPLVQWLRCHASKEGGMRSTPSPGTRIPHAKWHGQKVKNKKLKILVNHLKIGQESQ